MCNTDLRNTIQRLISESKDNELFTPGFFLFIIYILCHGGYPDAKLSRAALKKHYEYCLEVFDEDFEYDLYLIYQESLYKSQRDPVWGTVVSSLKKYSSKIFPEMVDLVVQEFQKSPEYVDIFQPASITSLVMSIIGAKNNRRTYNPYFGDGSYLLNFDPHENFIGQERAEYWAIGAIILNAHDSTYVYNLYNADPFEDHGRRSSKDKPGIYDLIVSTPPFRKAIKELNNCSYKYSDEEFIYKGLNALSDDGVLIGVFSSELLYNAKSDKKIRRFMIDSEMLEMIVLLPSGLYADFSHESIILYFNKQLHSDTVKYVDGRSLFRCGQEGRNEILVAELVESINSQVPSVVHNVDKNNFVQYDFDFSPELYFRID